MNEIEFARCVVSGQIKLPEEPVTQALLIHQSIDSLRSSPFDPRKTQEYIQVLKDAENSIAQAKLKERSEETRIIEGKVQHLSKRIFEILGPAFRWRNTRTNELVSLHGKTKWSATHLIEGPTLTSGGKMVMLERKCLAEGEEFNVSPLVDGWAKEYASSLVQEGKPIPSQAKLFQDFMKHFVEGFSVNCNRADPLLHPHESCSVFTSKSYVALKCTPLILLLEPV